MAKLQSSEFVGVANRPATICVDTVCLWFDTTLKYWDSNWVSLTNEPRHYHALECHSLMT